jgi:hypothetical protein
LAILEEKGTLEKGLALFKKNHNRETALCKIKDYFLA